jgi:hypothetical protein
MPDQTKRGSITKLLYIAYGLGALCPVVAYPGVLPRVTMLPRP